MIDVDNKGEWKVRIDRPVYANRLDIWIYKHKHGGTNVVQPDGMLRFIGEGEIMPSDLKPSLTLSQFDGKQMMYALAEALAEEGIKTPSEHRTAGILAAQSAHLEDLRSMLNLK